MSTKEIKQNTVATWRGIKKFYQVTVGVVESLAWLGLLATTYTVIYRNLKGYMSLNDAVFYGVVLSAVVISFRLAYEGARYFRNLGNEYER